LRRESTLGIQRVGVEAAGSHSVGWFLRGIPGRACGHSRLRVLGDPIGG
jgi:hypothetical protein